MTFYTDQCITLKRGLRMRVIFRQMLHLGLKAKLILYIKCCG